MCIKILWHLRVNTYSFHNFWFYSNNMKYSFLFSLPVLNEEIWYYCQIQRKEIVLFTIKIHKETVIIIHDLSCCLSYKELSSQILTLLESRHAKYPSNILTACNVINLLSNDQQM